jgi:hypothetical protein
MSYLASSGHEHSPGERRSFEAWVLETIENVWAEFSRKFVELWRAEARQGDLAEINLFRRFGAEIPHGSLERRAVGAGGYIDGADTGALRERRGETEDDRA